MNKIYFEKFKFNKYYKNIDLIDIAKLFINAAPKYYSFFYKNNILKNIVYDFKNKNSKNSKNIYFIRKDKKIIGVASLVKFLNRNNINSFDKKNFKYTKKNINSFKKYINSFSNKFIKLKNYKSSLYISRFAISQKYYGKDQIASRLLIFIIKNEKKNLTLHVSRENTRAINFYRKNNFKIFNYGKYHLEGFLNVKNTN
jgi:ribosomal protein S18 acetylase RimI-like enzyme